MADEKSEQLSTSPKSTATMAAVQSPTSHPTQRMVQNFLLVWVDENIDQSSQDFQNTLTQLRSVINDVNIFTSIDECVDFLTDIESEKAFMVLASTIGEQILPLIYEVPQLDNIYILYGNKSGHEQWAKKWAKLKDGLSQITSICEDLQLAVQQCNQDSMTISFIPMDAGASNPNLNQLEPSFMYSQIFKEILLEIKYDEKSIENLVLYCREKYADNTREQNIIEEFAHAYRATKSIWWYTRECFTYQMLNRALRTLEGDTIINMGFFISDLHRQLEELHQQQIGCYHGKSFIVYRGQGLSTTDFDKLLKTKGGLMSFNSFLSTSKKREVSLKFAGRASEKAEMVGILLKMFIDPSISSTPFAAIDEVSYYKTEDEVLFSMHTVFRIVEINKIDNNNRFHQVDLTLIADDDQQLRILTKRIREDINGSGWERMSQLLIKIGQFDKAEELYKILLDQASNEGEKALYYNDLGLVKGNQGDYEKALSFYKKSLEIYEKILPPNHPSLATSYNNIASMCNDMGEYSKALSFNEKSLDIREKTLPPNHPSLATSYNTIGTVYHDMGEHPKALEYFKKSLEIHEKTLPPNHPSLGTSCNNIGSAYSNMGQYLKALSFHEKSLEIYQKSLPPNHSLLASPYNNIGSVYDNLGQYSKALSFHEKSLEIYEKTLPPNHSLLASSYTSIGLVCDNMEEYSRALSFYEKSREILEKTLPPNHRLLASSYNNIGSVYNNTGQYPEALSFHEKSLKIREKILPSNHPDLAISYHHIGSAYDNMRQYSKAASFYEKSLEMREKTLPLNHPDLATSYHNIGLVYTNMRKYSQAITFFERSLHIFRSSLPSNHPNIETAQDNIEMVKKQM